MKQFVLFDHILSENICLFCFCVLFSNMYPILNLPPKIGLTHEISIVVVGVFKFCLRKYFYLSLLNLNY